MTAFEVRQRDVVDEMPVYASFSFICVVCGAVAFVTDGREVPHRCRIEIPDPRP